MSLFGKVYQNYRLHCSLLLNTKHRYSSLCFRTSRTVPPCTSSINLSRNRCVSRPFSTKKDGSNTSDSNNGDDAGHTPKPSDPKDSRNVSTPKTAQGNVLPVALINIEEHERKDVKIVMIPLQISETHTPRAKSTFRSLDAVRENLGLLELLADAMSGSGHADSKRLASTKYAERLLLEDYDKHKELEFWQSFPSNEKDGSETIKLYDNLDEAMHGGENFVKQLSNSSDLNVSALYDSQNHVFLNVPDAIAPIDMSPDVNKTVVNETLLESNEGKDTVNTQQTSQSTDQVAEEERVPLDFNAQMQGTIEVASVKYSINNLGYVKEPDYNDYMTAIAANLNSGALFPGYPTDVGRSYSTESGSSGHKKSNQDKTHVIRMSKGKKAPIWPGASNKSTQGAPASTETAAKTVQNAESESILLSPAELIAKSHGKMIEKNDALIVPDKVESLESTLEDLKAAEKAQNTTAETMVLSEPGTNASASKESYFVPGNVENLESTLEDLRAAAPVKMEINAEKDEIVELESMLLEASENAYSRESNLKYLNAAEASAKTEMATEEVEQREDESMALSSDQLSAEPEAHLGEDSNSAAASAQTEMAAEHTEAKTMDLSTAELIAEPEAYMSESTEPYIISENGYSLKSNHEDSNAAAASDKAEMDAEEDDVWFYESMVPSWAEPQVNEYANASTEAYTVPGYVENLEPAMEDSMAAPSEKMEINAEKDEIAELESMLLESSENAYSLKSNLKHLNAAATSAQTEMAAENTEPELIAEPEAYVSERSEPYVTTENAYSLESNLEDSNAASAQAELSTENTEAEIMVLSSAELTAEPEVRAKTKFIDFNIVAASATKEMSAENTDAEKMVLSPPEVTAEPEAYVSESSEIYITPENAYSLESKLEDSNAAADLTKMEMAADEVENMEAETMVLSSAQSSAEPDAYVSESSEPYISPENSYSLESNLEDTNAVATSAQAELSPKAETIVLSSAELTAEPEVRSKTKFIDFNIVAASAAKEISAENTDAETMVLSSPEVTAEPEAYVSESSEIYITPENAYSLESNLEDSNAAADSTKMEMAADEVENTEAETMVLSWAQSSAEPDAYVSESSEPYISPENSYSLESNLEETNAVAASAQVELSPENTKAETIVLSSAELTAEPEVRSKTKFIDFNIVAASAAKEIYAENTDAETIVLSSPEVTAEPEAYVSESSEIYITPENAYSLESNLEDSNAAADSTKMEMAADEVENTGAETMVLSSAQSSAEPDAYVSESSEIYITPKNAYSLESNLEDSNAAAVSAQPEMAAENTEAETMILSSPEFIAEPEAYISEASGAYVTTENAYSLESNLEDSNAAADSTKMEMAAEEVENTEVESMILSSAQLSAEPDAYVSESSQPYILPENSYSLESNLEDSDAAADSTQPEMVAENTEAETMVLSSPELTAEHEAYFSETSEPFVTPENVYSLESNLEDSNAVAASAQAELSPENTESETTVLSLAELAAEPEARAKTKFIDFNIMAASATKEMSAENTEAERMVLSSPEVTAEPEAYVSESSEIYITPENAYSLESDLEDSNTAANSTKMEMAADEVENTEAETMALSSPELIAERESYVSEISELYISPENAYNLESTLSDSNASEALAMIEMSAEEFKHTEADSMVLSKAQFSAENKAKMSETTEFDIVPENVHNLEFSLDDLKTDPDSMEKAAEKDQNPQPEIMQLHTSDLITKLNAEMSEPSEAHNVHENMGDLESSLEDFEAASAPDIMETAFEGVEHTEAEFMVLTFAELNMSETNETYNLESTLENMEVAAESMALSSAELSSEPEGKVKETSGVSFGTEYGEEIAAKKVVNTKAEYVELLWPEAVPSKTKLTESMALSSDEQGSKLEGTVKETSEASIGTEIKEEIAVEKDGSTQAEYVEVLWPETARAETKFASQKDYFNILAASAKTEMSAENAAAESMAHSSAELSSEIEGKLNETSESAIRTENTEDLEFLLDEAPTKMEKAFEKDGNTETEIYLANLSAKREANMSEANEPHIVQENEHNLESFLKDLRACVVTAKMEVAAEKDKNEELSEAKEPHTVQEKEHNLESFLKDLRACVDPAKLEVAAEKYKNEELGSMDLSSAQLRAEPDAEMSETRDPHSVPENIYNLEPSIEGLKADPTLAETETTASSHMPAHFEGIIRKLESVVEDVGNMVYVFHSDDVPAADAVVRPMAQLNKPEAVEDKENKVHIPDPDAVEDTKYKVQFFKNAVEDEENEVHMFISKVVSRNSSLEDSKSAALPTPEQEGTFKGFMGDELMDPKCVSVKSSLKYSKDAAAPTHEQDENFTGFMGHELMDPRRYAKAVKEATKRRNFGKNMESEPIEKPSVLPEPKPWKIFHPLSQLKVESEGPENFNEIRNPESMIGRKTFGAEIEDAKVPKILQEPLSAPEPSVAKVKESKPWNKKKPKSKPIQNSARNTR